MTANKMYVKLNNDRYIPTIGLGTWKADEGEVGNAVKKAIEEGYRHIDCAWKYGNQEEVGDGIHSALKRGNIKREELWVTSKLWNDFHKREDVEPHLRDTLSQLKLDYLDLFLVHWPVTHKESEELDPPLEETWKAMEELVSKGLVKTIGVSNFSAKKLRGMKDYAKIFPAVNQVECHPLWRQEELLEVCKELGVQITAYSPLGSQKQEDTEAAIEKKEVKDIAKKLNKTPGQVLIRWGIQRGCCVVPKSVTPSRIKENLDVYDWELPSEDMKTLNSLEPQEKRVSGDEFVKEGGPYKSTKEIWDE